MKKGVSNKREKAVNDSYEKACWPGCNFYFIFIDNHIHKHTVFVGKQTTAHIISHTNMQIGE